MSASNFTVFIVDDDEHVLRALSRLVRAAGYASETFASPRQFLERHDPGDCGCLILDFIMPEIDGLQLQALLAARGISLPIIFLTGRGKIETGVSAMKAGAVDFLTKPVDDTLLLAAIRRAEMQEAAARHRRDEMALIAARLATLTPRETQVLTHVIAGRLNKQIAGDLGTVEKTIKVHRGRMMEKLGVHSVADLVRLTERAGIRPYGLHEPGYQTLPDAIGPRANSTIAAP
jgi:FixJ family two-component response regulator